MNSLFVNYSSYDVSDCTETEAGKMAIQEGFSIVATADSNREIQVDILELYFENKRHSGGGPVKSCIKDGQQFIVTFEKKAGNFYHSFLCERYCILKRWSISTFLALAMKIILQVFGEVHFPILNKVWVL